MTAANVGGLCCYDVLAEKERMNTARYLEFLTRPISPCGGAQRHALCLFDDDGDNDDGDDGDGGDDHERPRQTAAIST